MKTINMFGIAIAVALVFLAGSASAGLPVTNGLQCWFDAKQGLTTNGTTVTGWADQSGNDYHATLGTGTPLYGASQINGRSAVFFRGGNNYLNINFNIAPQQEYIVFRSGNYARDAVNTNQWGGDWGGPFGQQNDSGWMLESGTRKMWSDASHIPLAVSQNGTSIVQNNANGNPYGMADVANYMILKVNPKNFGSAYGRIGRGNNSWGNGYMDVAEVIVFNRILTTGEENLIGGYLSAKYAITTAYPAFPLVVDNITPFNGQEFPSSSSITATAEIMTGSGTGPYNVSFYADISGSYAQVGTPQSGSGPLFTQSLGAPADGTYHFYVTVTDNVGSNVVTSTNTFRLVPAVATTNTLSSSVNPSTYGQSATFTATITPKPNGGSFQFYTNAVALGSPVAVNTGNGTAQASTTLLPVSTTNQITAVYSGYGIYLTSSAAALTQTVNKAVLTVTAENKVRAPGNANPAFTYLITGFTNGETTVTAGVTGAPVLGTVADVSSPAGSYPITNVVGTLSAANYSFTTAPGTLAIVAGAPPTVAANVVCWYDANVARTNVSGVVTNWIDQSGNAHHATFGSGSPTGAINQVNGRPAVQVRGGGTWLNCAGTFFTKEQYVVVRSPNATWNGSGSFLGRNSGRASTYNLSSSTTGFWGDQHPQAISKDGGVLPGPPFSLVTITNYMVLKIVVNDGDTSAGLYRIGKCHNLSSCDMDIAEIIGYNTTNSAADGVKIGSYLASKYFVTTTYPTPLTARVSSPFDGQQFIFGSSVTGTVTVLTGSGTGPYTNVSFFTDISGSYLQVGTSQSGSGTTFTQDLGTTSTPAGTYHLYATVTDNVGSNVVTSTNSFTLTPAVTTTTTLGSSLNPSTYGQSVTFTATITPKPNGGTVQFYNNAVAIGTPVAVNTGSGTAQASTTLLPVSTENQITAVYSGYGSYLTSSADTLPQTVNKAVLTVTADNKVRSLGNANPAFTYVITGYQNGETTVTAGVTGAPVLGTVADVLSPVGSYPITNVVGTLSAANYSFTTAPGTLAIVVGAPPVPNGLVCWYDASAALANASGVVTNWIDQSGGSHHATFGSGSPTGAINQVNGRPAVQVRGGSTWLDCAGGMFIKEQYVVVRSPNATWNGPGSFLGRKSNNTYATRASSHMFAAGTTEFWWDQSPLAVSKDGVVLPGGSFTLGTITNYMVLKIIVNANADAANLAQYPYYHIGKTDNSFSMDCDIAEIIGYNTTNSAADEAKIGGYLAGKYGIATTYPPPPPEGLAATAGAGQISLTWTAAGGATGYNIWRSTTSGSGYLSRGTIAGTSFTDNPVTAGTTYYYVVAATNSNGASANSAEVSAQAYARGSVLLFF